MLIDLHAKSSLSEGVDLSVNDVLQAAAANEYDAVAFCETLSTTYCHDVVERGRDFDIDVFVGVEIPTDTGILLGFAPELDEFYTAEKWRRYTDFGRPTPEAVLELFDEIGGAVVASRPYDRDTDFVMGDHIFELEGLDAVEVVNSRVDQVHNDFAVEAATYLGLPTVGGSDPGDSADALGNYGTFFNKQFGDQAGFVEALQDEEYWAVELDELG